MYMFLTISMKTFSVWIKAIVGLKGKTIYPKEKKKEYGTEFFQKNTVIMQIYKITGNKIVFSPFNRINIYQSKNQDAG